MTDLEEGGGGGYSKDYWDIVFDQLSKRRLFKLALAVLALLYASAIYAPLIANDRPYVLAAINYDTYERALKTLYPATMGLRARVEKTPAEFLAERTEGTQTYAEAVHGEEQAVVDRVATLSGFLGAEPREQLAGMRADAEEAARLALAGQHAEAKELATALKDRAKGLRASLVPIRSGRSGEEGGQVRLRGATVYPLLDATTSPEVFFMVLWAFVLAWPLWNRLVNVVLLRRDRDRIRGWRRIKLGTVLGTSVLAAVGWHATIGGELTFDPAPYKELITQGKIEVERVVFPPLALGFDEPHQSEAFRPPTWRRKAEINKEGFYVHGARAPTEQAGGVTVAAQPVDVRFGEPERNSPLRHVLGTDRLGRDLLVRALYGGRVSLSVGLVSTVILMVVGILIGCIAGYFGGRVDILISRFIEVVLCFPVFFLILVVVAFVGPSILNIMIIIGLLRWTGIARLARGEFLRLKELDFVVSAKGLGFSTPRIVFRHMLPNAMGPLLVAASFSVAAGILIESALSFLGFGIQMPIPSWGSLVNESKNAAHWWIHMFPGLLIFVTVLCYNLVGDGVRDAMDPKLKA